MALLAPATAAAQEDEPRISEERAIEIAERDPNAIEGKREHPDLFPSANQAESDRDWEVGFFAEDKQLVLVVVDDESGEVEESWTGHQVAWRMARGYDGAFGRKLNAPYVWLPLCAIFLIGLFDWRRPLRIAHLDLLVLVAGFGVSHFFFNRGEIGLSVPLAYPALLYLLARTLWLAFRSGASGLRPSLPVTWLAIATVALIGFRVGLNVADSNVIDVGYSGVIGADLISDREPLYDNFPDDNRHGDTYGPVAYYVYTPFEQLMPWSGDWDDLPAAHAAAIFFDLGTIAALFLLGRRLRPGDGSRLAILARLRLGRLPLHRLRPRVEHQRRPGRPAAGLRPLLPQLRSSPRRTACPRVADQVRTGGAGAPVRDLRPHRPAPLGAAGADRARSVRDRVRSRRAGGDGRDPARPRPLHFLGPHDRQPGGPRLAVQRLGPGGLAGVAAHGAQGPRGGPRAGGRRRSPPPRPRSRWRRWGPRC